MESFNGVIYLMKSLEKYFFKKKEAKMGKASLNLGEKFIRSIVRSEGLESFSVMLNNAFFHGEVFEKNDHFSFSDEDIEKALSLIYEAIDKIKEAANIIEG